MKLSRLEETHRTSKRELRAVQGRKEPLKLLVRGRDALQEHYANMAPEVLDHLTLKERLQIYNLLRLHLGADEDRVLTLTGIIFGNMPEVLSVQSETRMSVMARPNIIRPSSSASASFGFHTDAALTSLPVL